MAKRYYVCPIIGDGQSPETAYRPAISDTLTEQGEGQVSLILSDANGVPVLPYAFVLVSTTNHNKVAAVANVDQFPDITLDATLSTLTNPQRNALLNFLSKRGIDTTGLTPQSTFRDVVERIGKHLDANFSATNFDVRG